METVLFIFMVLGSLVSNHEAIMKFILPEVFTPSVLKYEKVICLTPFPMGDQSTLH